MAKFGVGDYIEYTNKKYPEPIRGEIICIDTSSGHYVINPSKLLPGVWRRKHDIRKDSSYNTFDSHFFEPHPSYNHRIVSKMECHFIGLGSRNIRNFEIQYDPKQMPDEEDDI